MDVRRNFILPKGTKLRSIFINNDISNPMLNLYFTSAEEALLSLYKNWNVSTINEQRLYINTFSLNEDIIINDGLVSGSVLRTIIDQNGSLYQIQEAIMEDCPKLENVGYVVPFRLSIDQAVNNQNNNQRTLMITGRISAYVICKPNLLIHMASFEINVSVFKNLINSIISDWYRTNRTNISVAVIIALLIEKSQELDNVLRRVFIQPTSPGLITCPIKFSPKRSNNSFVSTGQSDPFINLDVDSLRLLGLNMTLSDLLSFCRTSKVLNRQLCDNELFWQEKIRIDYGQRIEDSKPSGLKWKKYYEQKVKVSNFLIPANVFDLFDPLIRQLNEDEDPRYVEPIEYEIFDRIIEISLIIGELPDSVLTRVYDSLKIDPRWQNNLIPQDRLRVIFSREYLLNELKRYLNHLDEYDPELSKEIKVLYKMIAHRRMTARTNYQRRRLNFGNSQPVDYHGEINEAVEIDDEINEEIHQEQPPNHLF
jgi:hypothetical protein